MVYECKFFNFLIFLIYSFKPWLQFEYFCDLCRFADQVEFHLPARYDDASTSHAVAAAVKQDNPTVPSSSSSPPPSAPPDSRPLNRTEKLAQLRAEKQVGWPEATLGWEAQVKICFCYLFITTSWLEPIN